MDREALRPVLRREVYEYEQPCPDFAGEDSRFSVD
jgi:hypothetical protein